MQHFVRFLVALAVVALVAPTAPEAHFKLVAPAPWIVETERGDPQKAGPCGGSNSDWGTPSDIVTEVVGGSILPIEIQETIYHPGHYRVALAVNTPLELPPDPETKTRPSHRGEWDRPWSLSAMVEMPAQPPVLGRRPVPALRARTDADRLRDGGPRSQHQLRTVHAAGRPMDGPARLQQPRRLQLPPLRASEDSRRTNRSRSTRGGRSSTAGRTSNSASAGYRPIGSSMVPPPVAVSRVAGSGPRPSANACSSTRLPTSCPGRP